MYAKRILFLSRNSFLSTERKNFLENFYCLVNFEKIKCDKRSDIANSSLK